MKETKGENKGKLPKHFALKSKPNDQYLRFIHDNKVLRGFLQFSGDKVVSPYSKFEVQDSKTNKGLVHIRCSYNNKYWVRWSARSKYIVASATEPDEDQSKFSCTLFQPIYDHDKEAFRFKHVQLDYYLSLRYTFAPFDTCLFASGKRVEYDESDLTTVVDWDSLFVLPKHVAFRVKNGGYLRVHSSGTRYLQLDASDIGNQYVGNEIFTNPDGYCRIKNDHVGKFWIRDSDWIMAKADEYDFDNPNTLFWPVRLGNSDGVGVALRNIGNHKFCRRLTLDGKDNCLNASVDTITPEAELEIEELAIQRTIYDVNFLVSDARIYGETPVTMTKGEIVNKNSAAKNSKLKLRYEETKSSTWGCSVSAKLGMKITLESSIPEVSTQEIKMSGEVKEEQMYGETKETKTRNEIEHIVNVPPLTRVKVAVLATKGFCDIPYSYTQRDVLTNGKVVVQHFDDGIYTGVNTYNYNFLSEEERI